MTRTRFDYIIVLILLQYTSINHQNDSYKTSSHGHHANFAINHSHINHLSDIKHNKHVTDDYLPDLPHFTARNQLEIKKKEANSCLSHYRTPGAPSPRAAAAYHLHSAEIQNFAIQKENKEKRKTPM